MKPLYMDPRPMREYPTKDEVESVYNALTENPRHIMTLARRSHIRATLVRSAVRALNRQGRAVSTERDRWVRWE